MESCDKDEEGAQVELQQAAARASPTSSEDAADSRPKRIKVEEGSNDVCILR